MRLWPPYTAFLYPFGPPGLDGLDMRILVQSINTIKLERRDTESLIDRAYQ